MLALTYLGMNQREHKLCGGLFCATLSTILELRHGFVRARSKTVESMHSQSQNSPSLQILGVWEMLMVRASVALAEYSTVFACPSSLTPWSDSALPGCPSYHWPSRAGPSPLRCSPLSAVCSLAGSPPHRPSPQSTRSSSYSPSRQPVSPLQPRAQSLATHGSIASAQTGADHLDRSQKNCPPTAVPSIVSPPLCARMSRLAVSLRHRRIETHLMSPETESGSRGSCCGRRGHLGRGSRIRQHRARGRWG